MYSAWTGFIFCMLLSVAPAAWADYRPSFHVEHCAWNATHIVTVTEGEVIDGVVKVREVWLGNCRPGDQLIIPELAAYAPEASRAISEPFPSQQKQRQGPTHVTGSRMVLFLQRSEIPTTQGVSSWARWRPASSDMSVSCAWIQSDQAYAFVQVMRPGPTRLVPIDLSERQLKEQVMEITKGRAEFDRAMAHAEIGKRANALFKMAEARNIPFEELKSQLRWRRLQAQGHAIEALGGCGETAVPLLRRLWGAESFSGLYGITITAIRRSAGDHAGKVFADMLSEELPFWRATVPILQANWLASTTGDADKRTRVLRIRAHRLTYLLEALAEQQDSGYREMITEVRDLVRAMPEPDQGSTYQANCIKNCDRILAGGK